MNPSGAGRRHRCGAGLSPQIRRRKLLPGGALLAARRARRAALLSMAVMLSACSGVGAATSAQPQAAAGQGAEFKGWVVIRRDLREEQRMPGHFSSAELDDDRNWIFIGDLRWNTAGSRIPIVMDGTPSGYEVELIELPYNDRLRVLKLAVYEQGRERALAYTWAAPDSANIGINLRWMQAGLTRIRK